MPLSRTTSLLRGGRVIDPESGLDGIRDIAITGKKIAAISPQRLNGKSEIDAAGLVVAPGFIDLHSHGQTPENYRFKAMDGVTTALELEIGVYPVSEWYAARAGKSLVHYGASSGHVPARMAVMKDTGVLLPRDSAMNRVASAGRTEGHLVRGRERPRRRCTRHGARLDLHSNRHFVRGARSFLSDGQVEAPRVRSCPQYCRDIARNHRVPAGDDRGCGDLRRTATHCPHQQQCPEDERQRRSA